MPGPCRNHGTVMENNCTDCILWAVEAYNIVSITLNTANAALMKHGWEHGMDSL